MGCYNSRTLCLLTFNHKDNKYAKLKNIAQINVSLRKELETGFNLNEVLFCYKQAAKDANLEGITEFEEAENISEEQISLMTSENHVVISLLSTVYHETLKIPFYHKDITRFTINYTELCKLIYKIEQNEETFLFDTVCFFNEFVKYYREYLKKTKVSLGELDFEELVEAYNELAINSDETKILEFRRFLEEKVKKIMEAIFK